MRVSESKVVATLVESKDYGSAGIQSDAVNLGKMHSVSVLITFGALTGNSILTVYNSAARDLITTAIAFNYRLGAGAYKAALADQFGDIVAVAAAGLTLVAATFAHKQIVIEIDSDTMLDGKLMSGIGVGQSRYPGHLIPTVL